MKKIIFILFTFLLYASNSWAQNDIMLQKNSNCSSADYFRSGEIMKSPGISSETKLYEIELFPEQEYTGYWYYWGSTSIGAFSITPKVDWLDIDTDTIKLTGDNVQPVGYHFKSPKQTGIYETDVINTIWFTVHVKLTVTNLPISTSTYNVAKLDDSLQYKTRLYYNRLTHIGTTDKYFPDSLCSFWWKGYPEMDNTSIQIKPNPIEIPIDSYRNFQTFFSGDIKDERIIQRLKEWGSQPLCVRYKQKKVNPKECVVSFDQSTDQYIKTNYYPSAKPITVMYWVKFAQLLADQTIGSHDGNNHRVYLGINSSNNIYAGLGSGYTSSISSAITLNKWVHLALVGDGKNALVYLNGKQVANFTYTFSGESTNDIYIGQRNYMLAPDSKLQGSIDEFQIWDKALSEDEIKNYMNNCPYGNEVGLALYYPFREGEGNFTKDFSCNSHTGFITNVLNWSIDVPNGNPKIKGIFKTTPSMALVGQDSITMEILGNKFNSQSKAYLVKADGSKYFPNQTIFKDSLHLTLKFNFSRMNVGEYSLVVVNETNDTLKQENCFKLLNQELIPFGEWVQFKVNHGTVYASGVNVPAAEKLFVFVKKSSRTGYASTWKGKIRLLQDNEVIAQQTDDENYGGNIIGGSYSDFALQLPNAPSGLYTFEIDNLKENIQGEGEIMFASTPTQLKLNQWDKGTILRAYGSDWKMVIVPKNVDILTIQTEGMGLWSTNNIYYEDINQTANHWQFSNMGNGYTIKGIIKKPKSGVYFIKYMDSAVLQKDGSDNLYNHADNQTRDYMIYVGTTYTVPASSSPLSIEKLSTYTVGQGSVTIDIKGTGFSDTDKIKLIKNNKEYVAETFLKDSRNTSGLFNLISADTGNYELQIYSLNTGVLVKHDKMVLVESQASNVSSASNSGLWVSILGRDKLRLGRSQNVIIRYGNTSNLDFRYQFLYLSIPKEVIDTIKLSPFILDARQLSKKIGYNDTTLVLIPFIPANSNGEIEIKLKVLDNSKIKNLQIGAGFIDFPQKKNTKSLHIDNGVYKILQKNNSSVEQLSAGDLVFAKFDYNAPTASIPNTPFVHVGMYTGPSDPFETGSKNEYIYELDGVGKEHMDRLNYTPQEKADFPNDAKSYTKGTLSKGELIQKYAADVTPFINKNDISKSQLKDWEELPLFPKDAYLGSARPIDINEPNRIMQTQKLVDAANSSFKQNNRGDNSKYNRYGPRLTNDKSVGICGDLIADLYEETVGVDLPGFLNIPADMLEQLDRQGMVHRNNPLDYYRNQLLSASFLSNTYHIFGDFGISGLIFKFLGIVNSTTPEDKYGPIGASIAINDSVSIHYIDTSKVFEYRIDYWNKEGATAPAANVYIRDTLDTDFNLKTLNFTEVGFLKWKVKLEGGQYFNVNVDCRPDMPYIVNIEGTVDTETREVYWVHKTLDTLTMELPEDPLAGYLPPIDSTGYQIGWVSYTIKANSNLPDGTVFTNQAHVNFDGVGKWGSAPKEGPYTNIFDVSAPISKVSELPQTISSDSVLVKWKGTDKGCGLITYNIYVSKNGAGFEKWISTRDTLAWFRGVKDNTYEFYSIAIDDVGNIEVGKDKAEATVKMILQNFSVIISRKWDDVLVCNNVDKLFISYQWFKNDLAIVGATKQYYQEIGGLNGSYYVKVITTDGKTGISNTINASTSAKSIKAYPNPTADNQSFRLEIKATETDLKQAKLTISTLSGQVMLQDSNLQPQMLLSGLPKGCYIIHVRLTNGEQLNEKLMIN